MSLLKRLLFNIIIVLVIVLLSVSCANDEGGKNSSNKFPDYPTPDIAEDTENTEDIEDIEEEDTYSIWTDPCVECAWYFCGTLDVMYQKQICINNCDDPPTIVYEGQCEEHLECNPAQKLLETNIPCTTEDGYPGTKDKICDKGQIKYTNCETECSEEICDFIDNDCDGLIDEDVRNACNECC